MTVLTIDEYRILERHYYNLDSYVTNYLNAYASIEKGSESKRTLEKSRRLKEYRQQLSNYLHKQAKKVFPTLSEMRNDD